MTLLTWLTSLILATGLTAVLHMHVLVRLAGLVLQLSPLVLLIVMPNHGWLALVAIGGIIAFFAVRARARFAGWEFAVLWVLVSLGLLGPMRAAQNFGYDHRTLTVQLVLTMMTSLAAPALLVAGATAGQLAVSLSQWIGFRSAEAVRATPLLIVTAVLVVANLADSGHRISTGATGWLPHNLVGSAMLIVLSVVTVVVLRTGLPVRRWNRTDPSEPDELGDAWRRPAYLLAMFMLISMLVTGVAAFADAFVGAFTGSSPDWLATLPSNPWYVAGVRATQAVVAVVFGWRGSRAGDQTTPIVLGCYAALMAMSAVGMTTGWRWLVWEPEPLGAMLLVVVLVLLVVTRGSAGLHNALVVALVVWLYRFREVLSEPTAIIAAAAAGNLLLLSLLWRVLTDGELARGDSADFPRASRVLVYATMSLLAVASLAVSAQLRVQGSALDQTPLVSLGDRTLGGALYLAAMLAALLSMSNARLRSRIT